MLLEIPKTFSRIMTIRHTDKDVALYMTTIYILEYMGQQVHMMGTKIFCASRIFTKIKPS